VIRFSTLPIRTQLLILAILLTLPALGIIVYSGLKVRADDYNKAVIESQKLADGLADELEFLVREARQFGSLLAELPEMQSGRGERVQAVLSNALRDNPQYLNILIADASGDAWASAIPMEEKISVADRAYFKSARATLRFSAGEYAVGRVINKPAIHVAFPLVFQGKFHGAVIIGLDLDRMRAILGRSQLPANANYVLVDRNGIILSRGKALGENVGKPMILNDLKIMENGPDRKSYEFMRKDGERRIVTYRKLRLEGEEAPYMYVRAGMSLEDAISAANRQLFYNLATLLPFVILSFSIVLVIGKRSIADRVEKLQEAAHKIADGDLEVRVAPLVRGGEFGELALSFDHMASRLGENLADIRLAQHHIKSLNAALEQKVARRTAQLEDLVKEHESFNYTVSHDLRAPLRHINGFSAILNEELGSDIPPQCHDYLQRICAASSKMGVLIDELLEFSRISREEMKHERVDLSKIASEIAEMLRETEPERTVEVVIASGLTAEGDGTLLRIVLQNLLGNAWKYTGRNPAARIELERTDSRGEGVFYIRDNGAGFDMQYKDKLFAVFQRLHGSEYEGTGIGLATVERIIQRHNGRVWAESMVGEGATFYFTLPGD
jgi:signal transduction histidine kinase